MRNSNASRRSLADGLRKIHAYMRQSDVFGCASDRQGNLEDTVAITMRAMEAASSSLDPELGFGESGGDGGERV
jgi:hypothetical protein